jgi:ABC-type antimicrobial peptide transport system permease subunit
VYVPRRTAQYLWGLSGVDYDTLMLVDLRDGVEPHDAAADIEKTTGEMVVPVEDYRAMLVDQFSMIYTYVDAVNVVALVIAFLFIMVTLHTMVLQHRREIAILRSQGATGLFLMGQVLGEAMLLSAGGTIIGISMSFLAAWGISQARPLLTTTITPGLVLSGAAAALVGAALSAVVPAWQAARVDMLKALTLE